MARINDAVMSGQCDVAVTLGGAVHSLQPSVAQASPILTGRRAAARSRVRCRDVP